ncbi:hypothetical protein AIIKEEIJ_01408 [Rhodococcus sp. YH1]|nr:hypothetical protein [Rhodococcus sp. YH1]
MDASITTIIACSARASTAACAATWMGRSRLMENDGAGSGGVSVSTPVSTPFWLTATTLHPALPSTSSITVFLIWPTRSGAKLRSVETRSACSVIVTPGIAARVPATRS